MKHILILLIAATAPFSAVAQTGKSKSAHNHKSSPAEDTTQVKYTCPMDSEVVSNKPGKCPKCGMELTKVKTYSCSMHPEVVSDKPGKCPKCNMELTEVKTKSGAKKD